MKMLTGFLKPTSGMVRVGGIPVAENPLEAQRRIGYLPENVPLYLDMTVKEYLQIRMVANMMVNIRMVKKMVRA